MPLKLIRLRQGEARLLARNFGLAEPEVGAFGFLAEEDGMPLGLVTAVPAVGEGAGKCGRIGLLFVLARARGCGLGRLLHDRLVDEARVRGTGRLVAPVHHAAAAFLQHLGYVARDEADGTGRRLELDIAGGLLPVQVLDIRMTRETWAFEERYRNDIEENWRRLVSENPYLWNGRVLKLTDWHLEGGRFEGRMVDTAYAAFLAWRDWGYPDPGVRNLFGSAVVRSSDGALIFGRMAAHTATAGLCYPPGGNLDHADITADGAVDIEGSIARELAEETGLDARAAEKQGLVAVFDGPRISISAILAFPMSADEVVEKVALHNRRFERPELAGVVPIFPGGDISGLPMPPFARMLADNLFG